jgi:hypothetical protein
MAFIIMAALCAGCRDDLLPADAPQLRFSGVKLGRVWEGEIIDVQLETESLVAYPLRIELIPSCSCTSIVPSTFTMLQGELTTAKATIIVPPSAVNSTSDVITKIRIAGAVNSPSVVPITGSRSKLLVDEPQIWEINTVAGTNEPLEVSHDVTFARPVIVANAFVDGGKAKASVEQMEARRARVTIKLDGAKLPTSLNEDVLLSLSLPDDSRPVVLGIGQVVVDVYPRVQSEPRLVDFSLIDKSSRPTATVIVQSTSGELLRVVQIVPENGLDITRNARVGKSSWMFTLQLLEVLPGEHSSAVRVDVTEGNRSESISIPISYHGI